MWRDFAALNVTLALIGAMLGIGRVVFLLTMG